MLRRGQCPVTQLTSEVRERTSIQKKRKEGRGRRKEMVERGRNVCVPLLECGDVCEKGFVFKKGKGGRDINSPQPTQPPFNTPTHPPTHPHTENTPTHTVAIA